MEIRPSVVANMFTTTGNPHNLGVSSMAQNAVNCMMDTGSNFRKHFLSTLVRNSKGRILG